jgi:hypothetical protein
MDLAHIIELGGLAAAGLLTAFAWIKVWRRRRRGGGPGSGVIGVYDGFLTQAQRQAMELIVEERAAERRPEYPDGNLPDLEHPTRRTRGSLP